MDVSSRQTRRLTQSDYDVDRGRTEGAEQQAGVVEWAEARVAVGGG